MTSAAKIVGEQLAVALPNLSLQDQKMKNKGAVSEESCESDGGICAICLDKIVLQETALIKGCEHAYWINDYMFEESVCLLLRATWFKPLHVDESQEVYDDSEVYNYYPYEDDDDEEEDGVYYTISPSLRIGNRRWGDNGYVRSGRQEARPVQYSSSSQKSVASSSSEPKKKEISKSTMGRRAKRALKREAADKAAAAKHQEHLVRLGRN